MILVGSQAKELCSVFDIHEIEAKNISECLGHVVFNEVFISFLWLFKLRYYIYFRQPFIKQHNLEDFEFSPAYLFFWDKVKIVVILKLWSKSNTFRPLSSGFDQTIL